MDSTHLQLASQPGPPAHSSTIWVAPAKELLNEQAIAPTNGTRAEQVMLSYGWCQTLFRLVARWRVVLEDPLAGAFEILVLA